MSYRSVFRAGLFDGQAVVVTGGGSGIGRCTAHELASLGASLALVGRTQEKLERVKAELAPTGARVSCHACDIRDEAGVIAMVAAVLAEHGAIHGLVNNAGGQFPALIKDLSLKGWEAVVRNNLTGGFLVARECYKQWMGEHGGSIVNITADMWGGMPNMAHSGAARAGMSSFTESAACEWAASGVRVNSVAPGYVASSGFDKYGPEFSENLRSLRYKIPLQRYGTEAEVSAVIVFLLSEAASYITGSSIRVDGGTPNARPTWQLIRHANSKPYDGFPLAQRPALLDDDEERRD